MQSLSGRLGIASAVIALSLCAPRAIAQPTERSFRLDLSGGIAPREQRAMRVLKGERVKLSVTSNAAGELHVHGYRISLKIAPGEAGETTFDAYATGRYVIEWHGDAGRANRGHHSPPLAVLEVHPK